MIPRQPDLFESIPKPELFIGRIVFVMREFIPPGRKRMIRQKQQAKVTCLGNRGVNIEIEFLCGTRNRYRVGEIEVERNPICV